MFVDGIGVFCHFTALHVYGLEGLKGHWRRAPREKLLNSQTP